LFEWSYAQPLIFNNQPDSIQLRIDSDARQIGVPNNETSYEGTFQLEREEPDTVYLETINCKGTTRSNPIALLSKNNREIWIYNILYHCHVNAEMFMGCF